ncbi:MAG TPA: peptide chain release factor N(5)-glutamine methyltransferase [Syntrophomonadaceae bacterium]|nr:peptide chain release factor N(5)-glutamine methyltransferase [Syntrophomonadaceae bacterium]
MHDDWKIQDLLAWTSNFFGDKGIDNPRLEAEILLARVLNRDRVYLYANFDLPVNQQERELFRAFIKRRVQGEPAAYIVGHKEFMSLNFKVTPDVLIPRSDTEVLVESVVAIVNRDDNLRICDVGTGSGAIAVSLAHYLPNAIVYATDISPEALGIAQENATNNLVDIKFFLGDLLKPLENEKKFDILTANLPYVSPEEFKDLDKSLRDFEPVLALLADGDGLDLYRRLIPQVYDLLTNGGYVFFEIGYKQGQFVHEMVDTFTEVEIIKDLGGRDRVIKARKE